MTHAAWHTVNILISQHWKGGIRNKMMEMERIKVETACLAQLWNTYLQWTSSGNIFGLEIKQINLYFEMNLFLA